VGGWVVHSAQLTADMGRLRAYLSEHMVEDEPTSIVHGASSVYTVDRLTNRIKQW
jgi:hypothetical protein